MFALSNTLPKLPNPWSPFRGGDNPETGGCGDLSCYDKLCGLPKEIDALKQELHLSWECLPLSSLGMNTEMNR